RAIVELPRSALYQRRHRRRNPEVEVEAEGRALKALGRDADDRHLLIVDPERAADDVGGAAETGLPEVVRDDRDRLAAGPRGFIRTEEAAERRPHPQRRKIIARDEHAVDAHGAPGIAERERRHALREELREDRQPLAKIAVFLPR